jgi:MFS family permease
MIVLDGTIVNVALPTIRADLHFSAANLEWLITAYSLTFGGLLLFGGRVGDLHGKRRLSLTQLAGRTRPGPPWITWGRARRYALRRRGRSSR